MRAIPGAAYTPSMLKLNTTRGSPLHRLAASYSVLRIYIAAVLVTYVPLAITALFFGTLSPFGIGGGSRLPFLRDWNVAFLFFVSFPALCVLTLIDDKELNKALVQIQEHGIISPDETTSNELIARWQPRFRKVNIAAY